MIPENLDMQQLLAQAQTLQSQMQQAQAELQSSTFVGTAGGDLVSATLTGAGILVDLKIKPTAIDPSDPDALADLVIAAVQAARAQMDAKAKTLFPDMPDMSAFGL